MLSEIAAIIEQADSLFQQKHRFWPKPVVDFLEERQPRLSLRWAITLFASVLDARSKRGSRAEQRLWLDELSYLVDDPDTAVFCSQRAEVIWKNDSQFNFFERAISRLYTAKQLYHTGSSWEYRGTVIVSVVMLAENDDPAMPWDRPVAEQALSSFEVVAISQSRA
jgi:hypothetical protein